HNLLCLIPDKRKYKSSGFIRDIERVPTLSISSRSIGSSLYNNVNSWQRLLGSCVFYGSGNGEKKNLSYIQGFGWRIGALPIGSFRNLENEYSFTVNLV